jgi:hypothetical protein
MVSGLVGALPLVMVGAWLVLLRRVLPGVGFVHVGAVAVVGEVGGRAHHSAGWDGLLCVHLPGLSSAVFLVLGGLSLVLVLLLVAGCPACLHDHVGLGAGMLVGTMHAAGVVGRLVVSVVNVCAVLGEVAAFLVLMSVPVPCPAVLLVMRILLGRPRDVVGPTHLTHTCSRS